MRQTGMITAALTISWIWATPALSEHGDPVARAYRCADHAVQFADHVADFENGNGRLKLVENAAEKVTGCVQSVLAEVSAPATGPVRITQVGYEVIPYPSGLELGNQVVATGAGTNHLGHWVLFTGSIEESVVARFSTPRSQKCAEGEVAVGSPAFTNQSFFPLTCARLKPRYRLQSVTTHTALWGSNAVNKCPENKVLIGWQCPSNCRNRVPYTIDCAQIVR